LTAKDGGLFTAYAEGGKPALATADLGARWELEQIALRLWPSASSFQGMNTALFDLIEQHRIDPARVAKVRVGLSRPAFDLHGGLAHYKGKFEAMISAHYTAAVIVHDRTLTLAQFEPSRYDDPVLKRAAVEHVEVVADPALTGVHATAEIVMTDGSKLSARCEHPRGSPENPLTRAQIVEKLRTYAPDRISVAAIDEVVRAVDRLEDLASVRRLMDVLRESKIASAPKRAAAGGEVIFVAGPD